eukprot:COSAG05_NODE_2885_length_2539_cov_8.832787_1_plen_298_part_00
MMRRLPLILLLVRGAAATPCYVSVCTKTSVVPPSATRRCFEPLQFLNIQQECGGSMDRCVRWHISDPSGRKIPAAGVWYYGCAQASDGTTCSAAGTGTAIARGAALEVQSEGIKRRSFCCANSGDSAACNNPAADVGPGLPLAAGVFGWEYRQKPSWGSSIEGGCANDMTSATAVAPLLSVSAANMGGCQPKPDSATMNLWLGDSKDDVPHGSWQAYCVACDLGAGRVGDKCALNRCVISLLCHTRCLPHCPNPPATLLPLLLVLTFAASCTRVALRGTISTRTAAAGGPPPRTAMP